MLRRIHILLRALGDFAEGQDRFEAASPGSLQVQIDDALATLSDREAQAMRLRFGLVDGRARTLKQSGEVMGVTAERVRQLEAAALRKLREPGRRARLPRVSV